MQREEILTEENTSNQLWDDLWELDQQIGNNDLPSREEISLLVDDHNPSPLEQNATPTRRRVRNKELTVVESEEIKRNLPHIVISNLSSSVKHVTGDITFLLQKTDEEDLEEFRLRTDLTLRLCDLPFYTLNHLTALTLGFMIIKKMKWGLQYEEKLERVIEHLLDFLEEQVVNH